MIHIDTTLAWILAAVFAIALPAVLAIVQKAIVRHQRKRSDTARTGTVFFLADESGSTSPTDHDWMDNVVIDLLVKAGSMCRDFVYIGFSHDVSESRIFRFPCGEWVASTLAELVKHDQPGGTDYNPPLRRVISHLAAGESDVDIVIFTDGMGPDIAPDITVAIAGARSHRGARVHLIQPTEAGNAPTLYSAMLASNGLGALADTTVRVDTSITMTRLPVDITRITAPTTASSSS